MFPDSEIISPFGSCCKRKENQETLQSHCGIQIFGQAHDMFLRIFQTRIYKFFSGKYYVIIFLIFSKAQTWENMSYMTLMTNEEFVFVFNWEILVKKS